MLPLLLLPVCVRELPLLEEAPLFLVLSAVLRVETPCAGGASS